MNFVANDDSFMHDVMSDMNDMELMTYSKVLEMCACEYEEEKKEDE